MGRLELRIPLAEIVTVKEDSRRGVMYIIIEGDKYPDWSVGDEPVAIRIDHASSLVDIGMFMMNLEEGNADKIASVAKDEAAVEDAQATNLDINHSMNEDN